MNHILDVVEKGDRDLGAMELKRKEIGRDLQARRKGLRMKQAEFAARLNGYSRSAVTNAETGSRNLGRGFWTQCDRVCGTGTHFADWYDRIYFGLELKQPADRGSADSRLHVAAALKAPNVPEAAGAYLRLGWPVTETADGMLAMDTGLTADALEVPAAVGTLAARWWLETDGREDTILGIPALPSAGAHLAAIGTGNQWYFLVRAGHSPWRALASEIGAPERTAHPAGPTCAGASGRMIVWHAAGSRVPAPPGAPDCQARWEFLPSRSATFCLPPAHAVAHLLGRAAAATAPNGSGYVLPGGTLVMPAAARGRR